MPKIKGLRLLSVRWWDLSRLFFHAFFDLSSDIGFSGVKLTYTLTEATHQLRYFFAAKKDQYYRQYQYYLRCA